MNLLPRRATLAALGLLAVNALATAQDLARITIYVRDFQADQLRAIVSSTPSTHPPAP